MKNLMVFIILIFINIIFGHSQENEVKMYVDLVKSYERPTAVSAFLCWNKHTKIEFNKLLGSSTRPITITFINEKMKNFTNTLSKHTIIIADLSCRGIEDVLKMANNRNMFGNPYRWLMLAYPTNESSVVPSLLEDLNIWYDSEVYMIQEKSAGHFDLNLVYKIRVKQEWQMEYYGNWTRLLGLQKMNSATTKILRRRNLRGEVLSVTFNVDDRSTGFTNSDVKVRNSIHGVTRWGFKQILPLFDFINATRVNLFTDNWGYFVNGSWNGIVGHIASGEAELSGTPIFIAKERIEYLSYLSNAVRTYVKFVFREPPLSYENNLFLLPFNKAVWCAIAAFVLLMMVVIYVNATWETRKKKIVGNYIENVKYDTNLTMSDVAMMIVGAISQQGSFVELRGSIGRLVMFTLFFAFLFLFTAYSASIVALLQSSSKQIRTLSDLLNSRLELGVENTTYNVHYFTTATDPVRKAIYENKVAPKGSKPNFMKDVDGVKKLQKHAFAFHMDVGNGYKLVEKYFYEHEKCGLQEIPYIPESRPWLTCKKDSPYAELFKIGTARIREHGMSNRANRLVYSRKPVCSVSGGSFDSVSIIDVYPSLLMLLYGSLLACALLVAEVLFHRHQMKKPITDIDDEIPYTEDI